jgi:O-antigen ligase
VDQDFRRGWLGEELDRRRTHLLTLAAAGLSFFLGLALPYFGYSQSWAPHRLFKIAAGLLAGGIVLARPTWMPYLLCFAFPYAEWLPKAPIPFVNAMNLIVGGAILGVAVLTLRRKIHPPIPTTLNLPIFLFLGWMIVTAIYGAYIWPHRSFSGAEKLKTLWPIVAGFASFFIVTHLVSSRRATWNLVWVLVWASTLGLLGPLREVLDRGWGARASGGIGQPNLLGAYIALMGVLVFSIFRAARGWRRWLLGVAAILHGLALILPNSRGAYVGFLCGALPQALRTSIGGTLLLLVFLGSGYFWAPDFVTDRLSRTYEAASADDPEAALDQTSGGRLTVWRAILPLVAANPVFGVGPGNLPEAMHVSVGQYKAGHNLYLEVAGEMGIPGLVLLIWLFIRCWQLGRKLIPRGGRATILGHSYHAVILCMLAVNLFGNRLLAFSLAGMFFTLSGLVALEERFTRSPSSEDAV